jgi:peptidoglycan/xylan/chitin deacetylase (PgdA/CDA1 family)
VLEFAPTLYRAPYGHFVPATLDEAARRGWACVGWTVLGGDWKEGETGRSVADRVLAALVPGAIAVLHDGRRERPADHRPMLGAVEIVLGELSRRGLEPVTVSELLGSHD